MDGTRTLNAPELAALIPPAEATLPCPCQLSWVNAVLREPRGGP